MVQNQPRARAPGPDAKEIPNQKPTISRFYQP